MFLVLEDVNLLVQETLMLATEHEATGQEHI